ncbi:MAG: collagenase [Burkholderiales bacterium]|nr:collagenase [Burkholderiales bacterium]
MKKNWMTLAVAFAVFSGSSSAAGASNLAQEKKQEQIEQLVSVEQVLTHVHACSATLTLRSQALTAQQEQQTCQMLSQIEQRFHQTFGTLGHPVAHDGNTSLRANIYATHADFKRYATAHFDMPTDNGGMYLEGLPDLAGNQAEFVANQKPDGSIHNLAHEYVHYLDGRFNLYGDFCAGLHDSHSPPENCPRPAPLAPYLVWWTEGVAEYLSKGADNPPAVAAAAQPKYALSALFDTGYESNNGVARIYTWGYLAVRYMMEKQRSKVEQMLRFTRNGDYPRYQALVKTWGTSMDADFNAWLAELATHGTSSTSAMAR